MERQPKQFKIKPESSNHVIIYITLLSESQFEYKLNENKIILRYQWVYYLGIVVKRIIQKTRILLMCYCNTHKLFISFIEIVYKLNYNDIYNGNMIKLCKFGLKVECIVEVWDYAWMQEAPLRYGFNLVKDSIISYHSATPEFIFCCLPCHLHAYHPTIVMKRYNKNECWIQRILPIFLKLKSSICERLT